MGECGVILRCVLDGLLLRAELRAGVLPIVVYDGDEAFVLEAVEAVYYELLTATEEECAIAQRSYRLLRLADDFRRVAA
jgi:hypothetical protein